MSRKFYIVAKADPKTTLDSCSRAVEKLEDYGVDSGGEDFSFFFDGDILIENLILNQCKKVLRALWYQGIHVVEIGEDIEDESFVIYEHDPEHQNDIADMLDKLETWVEDEPEDIYDDYLSGLYEGDGDVDI